MLFTDTSGRYGKLNQKTRALLGVRPVPEAAVPAQSLHALAEAVQPQAGAPRAPLSLLERAEEDLAGLRRHSDTAVLHTDDELLLLLLRLLLLLFLSHGILQLAANYYGARLASVL